MYATLCQRLSFYHDVSSYFSLLYGSFLVGVKRLFDEKMVINWTKIEFFKSKRVELECFMWFLWLFPFTFTVHTKIYYKNWQLEIHSSNIFVGVLVRQDLFVLQVALILYKNNIIVEPEFGLIVWSADSFTQTDSFKFMN